MNNKEITGRVVGEGYPSGVRKTEYQKIVEGATDEQKAIAELLLREQSVQAQVDKHYNNRGLN